VEKKIVSEEKRFGKADAAWVSVVEIKIRLKEFFRVG
jgi:hypothetical protein